MHVHFTVDGWFCSRIPSGLSVSIVSSTCTSTSMLWFCFRWFCYILIICFAHTSHLFILGEWGQLHALLPYLSAIANWWSANRANSGEVCSSFVKFAVGYEPVNNYVYIILAHALLVARLQVNIALKYCRVLASVGTYLCRWPFYKYPVCLCFPPCCCCLPCPYCAQRHDWIGKLTLALCGRWFWNGYFLVNFLI